MWQRLILSVLVAASPRIRQSASHERTIMIMMMIMIMIIIIIIIIIIMMMMMMMMMMRIIIIIIVIIIAFKGAIRDFLQSPHCAANCLQHARSSGPGAIVCKSRAAHPALITCNMSCATWYEGTAQLLSSADFKSHLFELYFIGWAITW